jgi:flagellar biosynthetic protein FliR
MGFSMASAIDPQTGAQSNVLTQFIYIFTLLVFFSMDGHHMFIRVMANSFYSVPINSITFKPGIANELIKAGTTMFALGIKLAAPILVALFLSNLCLGIIARTVPQVNILMVGFPVNLSIGFVLFCLILMNIYPFVQHDGKHGQEPDKAPGPDVGGTRWQNRVIRIKPNGQPPKNWMRPVKRGRLQKAVSFHRLRS